MKQIERANINVTNLLKFPDQSEIASLSKIYFYQLISKKTSKFCMHGNIQYKRLNIFI